MGKVWVRLEERGVVNEVWVKLREEGMGMMGGIWGLGLEGRKEWMSRGMVL